MTAVFVGTKHLDNVPGHLFDGLTVLKPTKPGPIMTWMQITGAKLVFQLTQSMFLVCVTLWACISTYMLGFNKKLRLNLVFYFISRL